MYSSIIDEIKTKIYHNPRSISKILEDISITHGIHSEDLIESFIKQEEVHPSIYASLIEESKSNINEDLADYLKNKAGAISDKLKAKYTFGGTKQKAIGNQEKRERMEYLYNNWVRLSGRANVKPNEQNIKMYLTALKVDPQVISQVISKFKTSIRPSGQGSPAPIVPQQTEQEPQQVNASQEHSNIIAEDLNSNQLRDFFNNVAEIEQQVALKKLGTTVRTPKQDTTPVAQTTQKVTQQTVPSVTKPVVSQQDIESYISKLPASERADFVTKNILPTLSDTDVQRIVTALLQK